MGWLTQSVRRRLKKKRLLARSIMGFMVERPDGTAWSVLVLDSKDPHINGVEHRKGVSGPMKKIAETHGGGTVKGTWTDIDPTRYDEAHFVARSVLRDYWSRLAEQVRELETGQ